MGLFYSTINYLKSWYPYGQSQKLTLSQNKIKVSALKIIHTLKYKQLQIQKQAKTLQSNLLVAINMPTNIRSKAGQYQLMQQVIRKSELVAAYQQIIRCTNIIKNQAKQLQTDQNKISKQCILAICTIIYAYKDLQLSQIINLHDFIPQPYPIIDKKYISQALKQYVQYQGATLYTINTYILQMCVRNQIKLQLVNKIGHNFIYNPNKAMEINHNRQSKSSAMFALSVEDLPMDIQNDLGFKLEKIQQKDQEYMKSNIGSQMNNTNANGNENN